MKSFLDPSTRARIEIFPAAPSPRDLFQPGGWPARVRQLLGYFPDVFYPHLRDGKVPRLIAWENPPWMVLGALCSAAPALPAPPPTSPRTAAACMRALWPKAYTLPR